MKGRQTCWNQNQKSFCLLKVYKHGDWLGGLGRWDCDEERSFVLFSVLVEAASFLSIVLITQAGKPLSKISLWSSKLEQAILWLFSALGIWAFVNHCDLLSLNSISWLSWVAGTASIICHSFTKISLKQGIAEKFLIFLWVVSWTDTAHYYFAVAAAFSSHPIKQLLRFLFRSRANVLRSNWIGFCLPARIK